MSVQKDDDHGMILTDEHCDYSDLTKFGKMEITYTAGGIRVKIKGFEFRDTRTCRQTAAKSLAWARDALTQLLEAEKLAPGGDISCSVD